MILVRIMIKYQETTYGVKIIISNTYKMLFLPYICAPLRRKLFDQIFVVSRHAHTSLERRSGMNDLHCQPCGKCWQLTSEKLGADDISHAKKHAEMASTTVYLDYAPITHAVGEAHILL